ncbi:MAG: Co2+/Mg2+ efflux protein ApaG [Gammaproteobacteria bacterium]|nr:Co2+/Mg2+ efflux protein ApaG [Gammaproteobacteria bacterium]
MTGSSIGPRSIQVNAVAVYVEERSAPHQEQFFFAYTITINNTGEVPAKLLSRHWIITDGRGEVQEVRGDGVVGEQPHLRPGQSFQYTSAAILKTPVGSMHGAYRMVTDEGEHFDAPIAPFSLAVPSRLN